MQQFELRYLDRFNVQVLERRFTARDDAAAMTEAKSASRTHTLEVWHESRLVGRVERPLLQRAVSR